MTENFNWKMNEDDEYPQEESSSRHLLVALEDLLKRSHNSSISISKIKYQSKSADDLLLNRRHCQQKEQKISTYDVNNTSKTTRIELDLSGIEYEDEDNEYDSETPRSRSAPVSPTKIYDKELAAFIECEQQQSAGDNFVYNIDLSDDTQVVHPPNSRLAIFFDDDFLPEEINYEPPVNFIHSPLHNNNCLTITEENEEELEQLKRDDDEEQQRREKLLFETNENLTSTIRSDDENDQIDMHENDNQIHQCEMQNLTNVSEINTETSEQNAENLSTTDESSNSQCDIEEEEEEENYNDKDDKLIVYDIAKLDTPNKVNKASIIHSKEESTLLTSLFQLRTIINRKNINSCYTNAFFKLSPSFTNSLSASRLCGTTIINNSKDHPPSLLSSKLSIKTANDENSCSLPVINAQNISLLAPPKQQEQQEQKSSSRSSPMLFSTSLDEQTNSSVNCDKLSSLQQNSQHIKKMKVFQSSSSSLSDFVSPTPKLQIQHATLDEELQNVHHSLTDCSVLNQKSSFINENDSTTKPILDNHVQKSSSINRRILTNGLLLPYSASNPTRRRVQESFTLAHNKNYSMKNKADEKFLSDSSSSSESLLSSDEKIFSQSDFIIQENLKKSKKRKSSSLKNIYNTSPQSSTKILYPIGFDTNIMDLSWHQKQSFHTNKAATSDSGIIIDTHSTPKSSSEEDDTNNTVINIDKIKQYEINYQKVLTELTILKKNIVNIESRLNEAAQELEIEQALIEGEHELVFKQILDDSENDQQKIRHLNKNIQLLIERMMTEKDTIRDDIDYTQQILLKFENELREIERNDPSSYEKISKKKELIATTRKKYEDLEFRLMELETRCESELEKAEEHFQNEQKLVIQNAQIRQNTLRDLDHEQYVALYQAITEKENLEREKQKLKLIFKQKKIEANELQQKIFEIWSNMDDTRRAIYQSMPINVYHSLNYSDRFSSIKMEKKEDHRENSCEAENKITNVTGEKIMTCKDQLTKSDNENIWTLTERKSVDKTGKKNYEVRLREKNCIQERPLTRYLPIRSINFDLRAHIEGAGHLLESPHINLASTSCRGYLYKLGGIKFKRWNRRWFVFDREHRSLMYYPDKNETKLRGCINFQSILEVYVDHLQSISLRPPEPREATFIVKTIERPYYLVAPTVELMRIWVDVIITGAEGNTFAGV